MVYSVKETQPFKRDIKRLIKKYPSLNRIITDTFEEIEKGHLIGTNIITLKDDDRVYKVKEANPDARRGKSGGFRIIYFLTTENNFIFPLALYSKSDRETLSDSDIKSIVKELDLL